MSSALLEDPFDAAQAINPKTAVCWSGFWGEDYDFGDFVQHVVSRSVLWSAPKGEIAAPDWAMREAWPEHAANWEELLEAAWARDGSQADELPADDEFPWESLL